MELAHRVYWAVKKVNLEYDNAGKERKLNLNKLEEIRNEAYKTSATYKAKMKEVHDVKIRKKTFEVGQRVWLYNSRAKFFPGKLKSKWIGPYVILRVENYGEVEIENLKDKTRQVVNGYRLKTFLESGDINIKQMEVVSFLVDSPTYEAV
ncbi:uncharacterized protein LOC143565322 [Bidens hawaiensis]|uniref:uncharacterized protein LOC143565322 n=1 Tax=Bidens hawaiensis TaxID=980011 RepID=UPI0040490871